MECLIRFAQIHETFRQPEVEALSKLASVQVEIKSYSPNSPFCLVQIRGPAAGEVDEVARTFISRSVLARGIYELWGCGESYADLHEDVKHRSGHLWERWKYASFKFLIDSFCGKRSSSEQRSIIESFNYLGFEGKISMKNAVAEFVVFEEWLPSGGEVLGENAGSVKTSTFDREVPRSLKRVFLGRYIAGSQRHLIEKHDLKKRPYISTTSMDAELALVTATLALAASGKIFLDPFVGTGGFMVAAAELGAWTLGSDIDGRSFRGQGLGLQNGVGANFEKYGLTARFGDCMTSDLTHAPFRFSAGRGWLDGIICDPPYGVREGLKVLGKREASAMNNVEKFLIENGPSKEAHLINGVPAHQLPGYIAPKKPYSFSRMLNDILEFAANMLVVGGRLAFWMPTANEVDGCEVDDIPIPQHSLLLLKHECVQKFNKWSRRLLVYERLPYSHASAGLHDVPTKVEQHGVRADDLNPFRKRYFQSFRTDGIPNRKAV